MMNSLVDLVMSDKFDVSHEREALVFSVAAHVSADDSDDEDMTHVIYNPIMIAIPFEMISRGKEGLLKGLEETIDVTFGQMFFQSAVVKFKDEVLAKIAKMDLSKYEKYHFEDSPSKLCH